MNGMQEEGSRNPFQRFELGLRLANLLGESRSKRVGVWGTMSLSASFGNYDYRVVRGDGTDYPDQSLVWGLSVAAGLGPAIRVGSSRIIFPAELKLTIPFGEFNTPDTVARPADHGMGAGVDLGGRLGLFLEPPLSSSCSVKGLIGVMVGLGRSVAGPYLTDRRFPAGDIALSPSGGVTWQAGLQAGFLVGAKKCQPQSEAEQAPAPPTKPPPNHTQEVPPENKKPFQWDIRACPH